MPVASLRPVPLSLTAAAASEKPRGAFLPGWCAFARRLSRLILSRPACRGHPMGGAVSAFFPDPASPLKKASDAAWRLPSQP